MNRKPVNPVSPMFEAMCVQCGHVGSSLDIVCGEQPWTYICFGCQDDKEREAVRLNTNAAVRSTSARFPDQVALARRRLDIKRPRNVPMSPSWEGCGVQE